MILYSEAMIIINSESMIQARLEPTTVRWQAI